MPLAKGPDAIDAVYKGADAVSRIYKGPDLVHDFSGSASPVIRAQAIYAASSGSPRVVAIPAGAQVGDRLYAFIGASWGVNTPAGWTSHNSQDGSNWNGEICSKVLTSGDISTGTVSFTFTGSHANVIILVVMEGDPTLVAVEALRSGSGVTIATLNGTDTDPAPDDLAIFFATGRNTITTITANRGTPLHATLGNGGTGRGFSEVLSAAGDFDVTFTYSTSNGGHYIGAIVLRA